MNEEFIKRIYNTIVIENIEIYKNQFETSIQSDNIGDYTRKCLEMYAMLSEEQKQLMLEILKNVIIDTTSNVFGILDGSSTLNGGDMDIKVEINGQDSEDELQDTFLEFIEENA